MRLLLAVLVAWIAWTVVRVSWLHKPLHALVATLLAIVIDIAIFSWRRGDAAG